MCQSTSRGVTCSCKAGFTGEPYKQGCTDIDECKSRALHQCGIGAICVNQAPGYHCACPEGYKGDGRFSCEPVEVRTICNSDFDCTNNAKCGSDGACACRTGFAAQGSQCVDINECAANGDKNPCGQNSICVNIAGGYSCQCQAPMVGLPPTKPCQGKTHEVARSKDLDHRVESFSFFS